MPPFNPLPPCPLPITWDTESRIAELQSLIDDPATVEEQKTKLRAVIELYHRHELLGPYRLIQGGRVVKVGDVEFRRYVQQVSTWTTNVNHLFN